jgi:selenocysteine lyase/cysteine desulfurase
MCSPYKFLGPHCALLAAAPALLETITPDKLAPSTNDVPERFEFGTLPYEVMAGVTAAIDFLAGIAPGDTRTRRDQLAASHAVVDEHELRLRVALEAGLADLGDAVTVYSRAADRTPTLSMTLAGRRTWDAYEFLAARDVLAPASDFYAYEAFTALGADDDGALRIGIAPYTDDSEIERLLDGLGAFLRS